MNCIGIPWGFGIPKKARPVHLSRVPMSHYHVWLSNTGPAAVVVLTAACHPDTYTREEVFPEQKAPFS